MNRFACELSRLGSRMSAVGGRTTKTACCSTTSWASTSSADGVGGNAKGEVASAESVDLVHSWVKRWRKTLDAHVADPIARELRTWCAACSRARCSPPATWSSAWASSIRGRRACRARCRRCSSARAPAFIAQVGDSRVYLARDGKTAQLTEDHTLVNFRLKLGLITAEEAANCAGQERHHPRRRAPGLRRGRHPRPRDPAGRSLPALLRRAARLPARRRARRAAGGRARSRGQPAHRAGQRARRPRQHHRRGVRRRERRPCCQSTCAPARPSTRLSAPGS